MSAFPNTQIKKLRLKETVLFAINHVPQTDAITLKRFLELVNADGTFGVINHEQIMRKISLVLKYIPNASVSSLLIVMDLLDIKPSKQLMLVDFRNDQPNSAKEEDSSFLIDISQSTAAKHIF